MMKIIAYNSWADLICVNIFVNKYENIGIQGDPLLWLKSFLYNRTECANVQEGCL